MEIISGKIVKILFKNEENGYAAIKIKIKEENNHKQSTKYEEYIDDSITVTGYFSTFPTEGEDIEVKGEYVLTKYGYQINAKEIKILKKETKEAVVNYLSSDLFMGIGKALATKIYKKLGKNCLDLIKKDPKVLDDIDGLSNIQKDTIINTLEENSKKEKNILCFLNMGLTMKMARKIVTTLSRKEIEEVKENPYLLIDLVDGFGFIKADKIALENNMPTNDVRRIRACVFYFIKKVTSETGNTYVPKDYLIERVLNELYRENTDVNLSEIEEVIDYLKLNGKIIIEDDNIYEFLLYSQEGNLATNIACRINYKAKKVSKNKINKAFEEIIKETNIEYSKLQEEAIKACFTENIMIITGGPGTGKTTIVNGIVCLYEKLYKTLNGVSLLAPTGRAGKRLKEVTGLNAQTIHRFLGYDGNAFRYDESNKAESKFVIIDEMSMVDTALACQLFQALPLSTKILIVGDVDQIPSVSPGKVLRDLIECEKIKVVALKDIYRQKKESSIIRFAHSINKGIIPDDITQKQNDRSFIYMQNETDILNAIVEIVKQAIDKNMSLEKDIQILAPMYKGILGIDSINNIIQEKCNGNEKEQLKLGNNVFKKHDKVIQLVNRAEDDIMNGDIGVIDSFEYENNSIVGMNVLFDNKYISYNQETYDQIKLAYAISIHKSQGSEFYFTILPFSKSYHIMLQKPLYYTAITRSKEFLVMIGDYEALKIACKNNGYIRNTKLKEKIIEACDQKQIDYKEFENK